MGGTILAAGHERHVTAHLERLGELRGQPGDGTPEMGALLHRAEHVTRAQQRPVDLFRDVLREAAPEAGSSRSHSVRCALAPSTPDRTRCQTARDGGVANLPAARATCRDRPRDFRSMACAYGRRATSSGIKGLDSFARGAARLAYGRRGGLA